MASCTTRARNTSSHPRTRTRTHRAVADRWGCRILTRLGRFNLKGHMMQVTCRLLLSSSNLNLSTPIYSLINFKYYNKQQGYAVNLLTKFEGNSASFTGFWIIRHLEKRCADFHIFSSVESESTERGVNKKIAETERRPRDKDDVDTGKEDEAEHIRLEVELQYFLDNTVFEL